MCDNPGYPDSPDKGISCEQGDFAGIHGAALPAAPPSGPGQVEARAGGSGRCHAADFSHGVCAGRPR